MSKTVPASFDPFATHPFTNNSAVLPSHQPYPYARPIPTPASSTYAPPNQSSVPTSQTPLSLHAPQPQRVPPGSSKQPVFVPFKQDRSSPDLKDVLAKKGSPAKASKGPLKK